MNIIFNIFDQTKQEQKRTDLCNDIKRYIFIRPFENLLKVNIK